MIADRELDEREVEDDEVEDVEDLAEVAAAYPAVKKRIDLSRLNVLEVLSLGDVEDMARELGTSPDRLQSVFNRNPEAMVGRFGVVLAWILGRKRDPDLELDTVRRFWQIELVGVEAIKRNPPQARARTQRSSGRAGSSRTRG